MRLILTMRGTTVVDLELNWPTKQAPAQTQASTIEASGGGQAERAEPYGDPATISGFGFSARSR